MRTCAVCDRSIVSKNAHARYCSTRCRVTAHRAAQRDPIPAELREQDRWIRHTANKVPLTIDGKAASSTNPATWTTYTEAQKSTAGVGLGFVLNGDGLGCYDLDHCVTEGQLTQQARDFLEATPHFYAELSPSRTGLHIWHHAPAAPGTRKTINGLHVEHYTQGRYITITGQAL
jgi:primase-polymerase (primpol)-like protein